MGWLDLFNSKKNNPFASEDYYDRENLEALDYSPKELADLRDTRELGLGPVRIADGIAISRDGYFSAVLQIGTVNFALATAQEQEAIIGGYHAVLRQLAGGDYQIKVRMVEADLEPLADRVDYALSSYASAPLHRLALQYKQFLREELPKRMVLMERRNYVIVTVYSPLLVKMAQIFERETGKPAELFAGLGKQWREVDKHRRLQQENSTISNQKIKKGKKTTSESPAEQRREQLLKARAEDEMKQKMYEETERTMRQLKHQLNVLVAGLGANGLALHRLNDWELTALYAEYVRPELAQEVRHSLSAQTRNQLRQIRQTPFIPQEGPYGHGLRPLSLSEFMGEQSGTVVVSDPPKDSLPYQAGSSRASGAMAAALPAGRSSSWQVKEVARVASYDPAGENSAPAGSAGKRAGQTAAPSPLPGNTRVKSESETAFSPDASSLAISSGRPGITGEGEPVRIQAQSQPRQVRRSAYVPSFTATSNGSVHEGLKKEAAAGKD